MKHALPPLALLCFVLLLAGCGEDPSEAVEDATDSSDWIFGAVNAQQITDMRQDAAAQGKVLVIDCWATWCGSCVEMFPHLHEAMKERGDDVYLVSLSFDEGQVLIEKAKDFLEKQQATAYAYRAAEGSDATDAIAKALSNNWGGTILPAVFVYHPDGTTAYELLETRGEVQDWVDAIASAVDESIQDAEGSLGE